MSMHNNLPPGVSHNDPHITGEDEYTCLKCGEIVDPEDEIWTPTGSLHPNCASLTQIVADPYTDPADKAVLIRVLWGISEYSRKV